MRLAYKKIRVDNFFDNIFLTDFAKNACGQVAPNRLVIGADFYPIFANFLSKF